MISKSSFILQNIGKIETKYEVTELLGSGSYGKVFKVKNKVSGKYYACKRINKKSIRNKERLKIEINLLKETDHPNIIRLHELYEDSIYLYFVTELCTGGEFFDVLAKKVKEHLLYTERQAAIIFSQIISAINYCHSHGICHRDIKPENIMFVDSNLDEIKLIDFGLSQIYSKDNPMHSIVGTTYYMAPEVIEGQYDEKCDIWSAGCILYIMLSGRPPFYAKNKNDLMNKIKQKNYSFNYTAFDCISYSAKNLITMMLCDSSNRITAQEIISGEWLSEQLKSIKNSTDFKLNLSTNCSCQNSDDSGLENSLSKNKINYPKNKKFYSTVENNEIPLNVTYDRMQSYSKMNKVKRSIFEFIANQMSHDEISNLNISFGSIDKNKDGIITLLELSNAISNICQCKNLKESIKFVPHEQKINNLKFVFSAVDLDRNGLINYTEFLAAAMDHKDVLKKEMVYEAFRTYDFDSNGKITAKEFMRIVQPKNIDDKLYIEHLIKQYDLNKDGEIDLNEFMNMIEYL